MQNLRAGVPLKEPNVRADYSPRWDEGKVASYTTNIRIMFRVILKPLASLLSLYATRTTAST